MSPCCDASRAPAHATEGEFRSFIDPAANKTGGRILTQTGPQSHWVLGVSNGQKCDTLLLQRSADSLPRCEVITM